MKQVLAVLLLAIMVSLTGCATSHMTQGRDFSSSQVQQIQKGKTTKRELIALFGQPFSKSVVDGDTEKWLYFYSDVTSKARSAVFTMKVQTTGIRKQLDVLLKNDIVTNYTHTETPIGSQLNTKTN